MLKVSRIARLGSTVHVDLEIRAEIQYSTGLCAQGFLNFEAWQGTVHVDLEMIVEIQYSTGSLGSLKLSGDTILNWLMC